MEQQRFYQPLSPDGPPNTTEFTQRPTLKSNLKVPDEGLNDWGFTNGIPHTVYGLPPAGARCLKKKRSTRVQIALPDEQYVTDRDTNRTDLHLSKDDHSNGFSISRPARLNEKMDHEPYLPARRLGYNSSPVMLEIECENYSPSPALQTASPTPVYEGLSPVNGDYAAIIECRRSQLNESPVFSTTLALKHNSNPPLKIRSLQLDNHIRPQIFHRNGEATRSNSIMEEKSCLYNGSSCYERFNQRCQIIENRHDLNNRSSDFSNENLRIDGSSGYGSHSSQEAEIQKKSNDQRSISLETCMNVDVNPEPARRHRFTEQQIITHQPLPHHRKINDEISSYYWVAPQATSPRIRRRRYLNKISPSFDRVSTYENVSETLNFALSEPRLNELSELTRFPETSKLLRSGINSNKTSLEELNFWKRLSEVSQTEESTLRRIKTKISLKTAVIYIKCTSNGKCLELTVNNEETVLDILKKILDIHSHPITIRTALIQRFPIMKVERIFEDDEIIYNQLDIQELRNGYMEILLEEREDTFGIFEDARTWLRPVFANMYDARMSRNSIEEIFGNQKWGESINLPNHKDVLFVRTQRGKWKRRYCTIRTSGIYAGKHKYTKIDELIKVVSFSKNLRLYTSTGRWSEILSPTLSGFILNLSSNTDWYSDAVLYFCTQDTASLNSWYGFIRIALTGKNLWTNYKERLRIFNFVPNEEAIFNLSTNENRERLTNDDSVADSLWGDRKRFLLNKKFSNSSTTITTGSIFAGTPRNNIHNSDTLTRSSCDFSRYPRKSRGSMNNVGGLLRSQSASSWSESLRSRSGSVSRSISDFFTTIVETSDRITQPVRRKLLGHGPSARRVSRSIRCISAPFGVVSTNPQVNSYNSSNLSSGNTSPFPGSEHIENCNYDLDSEVSFQLPPEPNNPSINAQKNLTQFDSNKFTSYKILQVTDIDQSSSLSYKEKSMKEVHSCVGGVQKLSENRFIHDL